MHLEPSPPVAVRQGELIQEQGVLEHLGLKLKQGLQLRLEQLCWNGALDENLQKEEMTELRLPVKESAGMGWSVGHCGLLPW